MELLSYPKSDYLLNAPLESLHQESLAWLNEIGFWADEMVFFYRLLHHKKLSKAFPTTQLAEIEMELVKLNSEDLERIKVTVTGHERLLASAFQSISLADEQVYREAHKMIMADMRTLHEAIRTFKRKIFSFVEK